MSARLRRVVEVAALQADEVACGVVVGCLQPGRALSVGPGGEAAPADDVGARGLLLVGRLGLHGLLPLHELRELAVVVLAEVAADGLDEG